jgi:hypothetical protein
MIRTKIPEMGRAVAARFQGLSTKAQVATTAVTATVVGLAGEAVCNLGATHGDLMEFINSTLTDWAGNLSSLVPLDVILGLAGTGALAFYRRARTTEHQLIEVNHELSTTKDQMAAKDVQVAAALKEAESAKQEAREHRERVAFLEGALAHQEGRLNLSEPGAPVVNYDEHPS